MLAGIKAIDKKSVHNICSGQVIISLATAVKELLENSIDAGANLIQITFREYGRESIEVSDDGSGIDESQFQGVTLKHHTSKIKNFEDVAAVKTFGFRGEAISSLCSLGNLKIHTSVGGVGSLITYDNDGHITEIICQARTRGTTVSVTNLFSKLPVRHKQFVKNIRKEFHKAIDVLQAYAIISLHQRLHCINITDKRKQVIFSSQGKKSLRDNITQILSHSIAKNLEDFNIDEEAYRITGFISKPVTKCGRGSNDKQFIFINNRPCDHEKISKLINSLYRSYEKFQYPVFVIVVEVKDCQVDVNVTPDKRQIFLDNEENLLIELENVLRVNFAKHAGSYSDHSSTVLSSLLPICKPNVSPKRALSNDDESNEKLITIQNISHDLCETDRQSPCSLPQKEAIKEVLFPQKSNFTIEILGTPLQPKRKQNAEMSLTTVNPIDDKINFVRSKILYNSSMSCIKRLFSETSRKSSQRHDFLVHYKHQIVSTENAELELNHTIAKSDFRNFRVIGQFNLGFILVRYKNNLFIIDQHATDEKYRFETLQKETQIQSQKLIAPKKLQFNGAQEEILIQNLSVFQKNGFEFDIRSEEDSTPGNRAYLTYVPQCKNWEYDAADVEELLWLLSDKSTLTVKHLRPSKVRRMFASQACRSAVMIGTALDTKRMSEIVTNMSDLDHPWNCPHGRPTMRHVVDLSRAL